MDAQPDQPKSGAPAEDVFVGNVSPGTVSTKFTDCLMRTIGYDRYHGNRISHWLFIECSANISTGRNTLVERFLESNCEWLIQIDSDMVWQPDAVHQLLAVADPVERPVIGGLCFAMEGDTGLIWPTIFDLGGTEENLEFIRWDAWEDGAILPVASTGAAFLLAHRSVFEAIRDRKFSEAYPWFQERELGGLRAGEDVTFCIRAAGVGVKVHVHTGVGIGHIKKHTITVEGYRAQRAMLAQREYLAEAYPEEYEK